MSEGEPNTIEPSPIELCRQLGRWIAQNGLFAEDLLFVEDADATSGHVYARPLPDRSKREAKAISITESDAQPTQEDEDPSRRIMLSLEARAGTRREAQAALEDVRRLIRPNGKSFFMPPFVTGGDFDMSNVIGYPPPSLTPSGSAALWRVINFEIVADVQPGVIESSEQAKAIGGQGSATMTIAARVLPVEMPAPINAFRAWNSLTSGTVEVRGVNGRARQMIFRHEPNPAEWVTQTIDLAAFASLTELYAAIGALGNGWTSEVPGGWLDFSEREPRSLEITPRTTATAASKATIRVLP